MDQEQLWMPNLNVLEPVLVLTNAIRGTCLVRGIHEYQWQEWPKARLAYYRQATEEEAAVLLPQAA